MPITEAKIQPAYPEELVQIAREKGYKAANLDFLDKILLEFKASAQGNINIEVPKHISISNQDITAHLNQYAPKWQEQWGEFCDLQGSDENLRPEAITKLAEIQVSIKQAFTGSKTLKTEDLDQAQNWMVRSTGEEDRVDVANPGGNESVPSDTASINPSIAQVVASYFSEKSMSQRLKSGENIIAKPPLMACLIQKLIGEKEEVELPPVSGVIYTDGSGNVRIQAAPGHGELVVNSKGNFDNIFVTKENVVHQYLGDKKIRLVPKFDFENKKINLEEVSNVEFAKGASLSEEVSMDLAKFANFVEAKYGMRMDLEFVFDPNSKMINIVQARPIPLGKRKGLIASALSDDFIAMNKPAYSDGQIITPDVMTAKAITNKAEILVCDTIDEALGVFLKDKDNKIKAVIINKASPDTSHEAGFFSSQAIPVIYAAQYDLVKGWADNLNDNILIIDPQRASIYQIKQDQFQESLIEEGVFRSTLAPFVTPIKRDFAQGPSNEYPQIKAKSIGELVIEARTNPEATQRLFRFVHDEIGVQDTKLYDQKAIDDDIKQLLTYPSTQEDFQSHAKTLAHLLNFVVSVKNEKEIADSTYEQLIINGMELHKALKEIEANPQDPQTKIHYLDIHQKFKGLMVSEGTKDVLSTSIRQEIRTSDEKEALKQQVIEAGFDLTKVDEKDFLNLARNNIYLFREEDQQKWLSFCYSSCQKGESEALQILVGDVIKLGLKDYWMNTNFLNAYNNNQDNALSALNAEYEQNLAASSNILQASKMIDRLEHQIGQWAKPENFNKLFEKEFKKNVIEINQLLSIDSENKLAANIAIKQLYRLTDVMDLSIKQLQNSHLYEDKEKQVENFRMMLGEFFILMNANVEVNKDRAENMKSFLDEKLGSKQSSELMPSEGFSVINADFFQESIIEFNRGVEQRKTLADLHTLIHQTLLGSVARKSGIFSQDLMKVLPEFVSTTNNNILNSKSSDFANASFRKKLSSPSIKLLYVNADHPYINLNYNIPLREHSAILKMQYNINDKEIQLDYTMFGDGVEGWEEDRWKDLEGYGFLLLEMFSDAKLIEHKSSNHLLNLQLRIKQDSTNLKELFGILNIITESSFDSGEVLKKCYFENHGLFTKMLEDKGLSQLILESYRVDESRFDLKALHEVIQELKQPNESTHDAQTIKACLRLIAMDYYTGAINHDKLKALEMEFSNSEINFANLIIQNFYQFPDKVRVILICELINRDQTDKALELSKGIIDKSGLVNIVIALINKDQADKAFELAQKITYKPDIVSIATALINKDQPDKAFDLAERITDQSSLANVATALINKDYTDKALDLAGQITDGYYLANLAIALINKEQTDKALKLAEKITDQSGLVNIAKALINKDHTDKELEVVGKITKDYYLAEVATALINKDHADKALELAGQITDGYYLANLAIALINKEQTDKALKLAEKITDQSGLVNIAKALINKDKSDRALELAGKIATPLHQKLILEKVIDSIESLTDPEYAKIIDLAYDLAAKQNNEEVMKKLLPYTSKSNIFCEFKDPLQFPMAEAISPPASNSGYIVQDHEKPAILQNKQQLIAQDHSQRAAPVENSDKTDPAYNVGFADNLNLLRVGAYVAKNIAGNVNEGWVNMFGGNAAHSQVKEAISSSKKQLKTLGQPLMEMHKEVVESYELKIAIHNKKPNKLLGDEIYQLKQLKEQSEQMMKDLREANQWSLEFKNALKDGAVIKQAHVEKLEQKIVQIKQTSEKFFEAVETSNALNKSKAASAEIAQKFREENTLPKSKNIEQLPSGKFTNQLIKSISKSSERFIK